MTIQVRLICESGTALRYPGAIPMAEGDSAIVSLVTASTKEAPSIETVITSAADAPALGVDGVNDGVVSITAIGGAVKVREYTEVNPFMSDGDDGYEDTVLRDGETITAATIAANAKTLVVMGGA